MQEPINYETTKDHDFLKFNSVLSYVGLRLCTPASSPHWNPEAPADADLHTGFQDVNGNHYRQMTPDRARQINVLNLGKTFEWLRGKNVKRILKLVIDDDQEWQCSDEVIENTLKSWDIRYLDWNKKDLSISAISQGEATKIVELWLNWGGQNTALLGWADPISGLKSQLPRVRG